LGLDPESDMNPSSTARGNFVVSMYPRGVAKLIVLVG
jgi:hypothetical protein